MSAAACLDLSRHLAVKPCDSMRMLGRARMRGRAATAVAVVHRTGGEAFTHLYLVPDALVGGRAEVRLAAVLAGERIAEATAAASGLPGFEPFETPRMMAA